MKAADTHRRIMALRRKHSAEMVALEQAYSALRRLPKSATHKYVARPLAGWLCAPGWVVVRSWLGGCALLAGWLCACNTVCMLASALVAEMAAVD